MKTFEDWRPNCAEPSVGHVSFPLVRTRCFTASQIWALEPLSVWEQQLRLELPTHSRTPLFNGKRGQPICLLADSRGILGAPLPILWFWLGFLSP